MAARSPSATRSSAPPVVVINEAMAKQFWPKGDPLSDRLIIGRGVMREFADEPERQIIGVVADSRDGGARPTIRARRCTSRRRRCRMP